MRDSNASVSLSHIGLSKLVNLLTFPSHRYTRYSSLITYYYFLLLPLYYITVLFYYHVRC